MQQQLRAVDLKKLTDRKGDGRAFKHKGFTFKWGTNYWGALNTAYKMIPAPDTIYLIVEPTIAFPNEQTVRKSYQVFQRYGLPKPENTTINFVVGRAVEDKKAMKVMLNLLHGGGLSPRQIRERLIF